MTLDELWTALGSHDWYYDMSEDPTVYRAGRAEGGRLFAASGQSEEHMQMYIAYQKFVWGKGPEPKREDYVYSNDLLA